MTEEVKKQVKSNFNAWMELQDRRKALSDENKMIVGDTASLLEKPKPKIGKLFKALKSLYEDGENEIDELSELLEEIQ